MNSAFRAIWLVPLSRDIKYYSPPGGFRRKKMSREPYFVVKYSSYLGTAIKLVLYILKQLFASVSVNSGGYLPRRSGSVNIHRYSPPLRRIIVNYWPFLKCCNFGNIADQKLCSSFCTNLDTAPSKYPSQSVCKINLKKKNSLTDCLLACSRLSDGGKAENSQGRQGRLGHKCGV